MESALSAISGDSSLKQPGLKLIETLGWTGQTFPRLALHMARLSASAARLGWPCDPMAATSALRQTAPAGPARMRLTLDATGALAVQATPMPPPIPSPPPPGESEPPSAMQPGWRVGLAADRLRSADPWLTLKTTHRPAYDTARAALPPGLDEVIFQNERGEVCDGTITTVFFDRGQGLRTPPLTCGLLPGVLRAELACPQEILLAQDLPQVRLWVGNSLRGLIPARFIPA